MNFKITPQEQYSLASVTVHKSKIVKMLITADIHQENSVTTQCLHSMYANMLLSGTKSRNREEFLEAVNLLGASVDISVSAGRASFELRATAEVLPKLLKLFSEMMTEPAFSATELKRVQSTTINQLHQAKEDSKSIAEEKLQNIFYGAEDRKYTYSIDECISDVNSIKPAHFRKMHERVVNTRWFVTVGGSSTAINLVDGTISKLKKSSQIRENVAIHQPYPPKPVLSLEDISSRQNIDLSIGTPLPITNQHPDFIPLTFAVAILGKWGGFTGRLMSTVRDKEGLTYGIYARLEGFVGDEQGHLRIMTFFAPDKTIQGLTSTFREITTLYKKGVSDKEVAAFKTILGTQQTLLQDSLGRTLGDLHSYHFQGFTIEEMHEHKALLEKVTTPEVNQVIQSYLDPANMSVSGAGPVKNLQKALRDWHKTV